jgi:hypothetical protein
MSSSSNKDGALRNEKAPIPSQRFSTTGSCAYKCSIIPKKLENTRPNFKRPTIYVYISIARLCW